MDNAENPRVFQDDLLKIARTTLSSKLITSDRNYFADLCVDAVRRLKGSSNLDYIQIIKVPGGTITNSYLDDGFILKKQITIGCKRRVENAEILVANTAMDYDKIKIYGTKVKVNSMEKVAEIEAAEKEKMKQKVDKILAYKPTVFVNRQLIYNYPEQLLADAGITVIEHADFEGMERIAAATGAEIVSTFDAPQRREQVLGRCNLIEEIMIGEDKVFWAAMLVYKIQRLPEERSLHNRAPGSELPHSGRGGAVDPRRLVRAGHDGEEQVGGLGRRQQ